VLIRSSLVIYRLIYTLHCKEEGGSMEGKWRKKDKAGNKNPHIFENQIHHRIIEWFGLEGTLQTI